MGSACGRARLNIGAKRLDCTIYSGNDYQMFHFKHLYSWSLATVLLVLGTAVDVEAAGYDGRLTLIVTDEQTGEQIPVRMELINSRGRPVRVRAAGAITRDDYVVFDGQITLELSKGAYRFLIEAGPEYQTREGHFAVERHAEDTTDVKLRRHVNMPEEGWWAGDLDVHQRRADLPLLQRAAGVSFVPEQVRKNIQGKYSKQSKAGGDTIAAELALDYRRGGGLLIFGRSGQVLSGVDLSKMDKQASSMSVLQDAQQSNADVVALTPYAWDLPLWIATDNLTAVQILHRQSWADGKHPNEGWGRPRDKDFFAGKQGNGLYSEMIYHHLLNCGLRIPPAAGSGSGANSLPVGLNRVYVNCGKKFTTAEWFAGIRAGRVTVTNGPLLRTSVEGESPGHVFHLDRNAQRQFQIALSLSFYKQAPVEYLEIVKDGHVEYSIRLDALVKQKGRLPPLEFDQSGWFLVRAVTSSTETYQYASTGPYYVERDYRPRISQRSVEYFLRWLAEAKKKFAENEQVSQEIEKARPFWEDLLSRANAE